MWDGIRRALRYPLRPRLSVYFDPASTYQTQAVDDAGGAAGYFCHVMVRTTGRVAAQTCRGRMLEVRVRNGDGSTGPAPGFPAPMFLKWAREPDFGPRNVEANQPRPLDLCFTLASAPDQLRFSAPPSPSGVLIFPPGVYRVKVRVTADDTRAADGVFLIDFTRGWDRIVVEQL